MKSRRMRLEEQVTSTGQVKYAHIILVGKPEGKTASCGLEVILKWRLKK
jgi:hypothetical protein